MMPGVAFGRLANAARHFGAGRRRIRTKLAMHRSQSVLTLTVYRFTHDVSMMAS
jgi:hypothetical protein